MFSKKAKLSLDTNQIKEIIEKYFLVKMPDDFFKFWSFCSSLNPLNPKAAFNEIDLLLVGPFDILEGKLDEKKLADADPSSVLCYYRFYYDVPELQTVIRDPRSNFHIGYFRDSPSAMPSMVVSNDPDKSCIIQPLGDNIFSGLIAYCEDLARKKSDKKAVAEKMISKMKTYAEKNNFPLTNDGLRERRKKVVAKTFHGAGIVVPFENDVGYRPLPETEQNLKKLLKKIADMSDEDRQRSKPYETLKDIVNLTNLANDETDFGMALELGIDLFCFGHESYHKLVSFLLGTAYELLERHQFGQIIEAHLADRRNEKSMKFTIKKASSN